MQGSRSVLFGDNSEFELKFTARTCKVLTHIRHIAIKAGYGWMQN